MKKWRFEPNLEYQIDAINSVVNLFEGQDRIDNDNTIRMYRNELNITPLKMKENLTKIQKDPKNNVGFWDEELLPDRKFTIEMETGTGKTYVYLRTMIELYKKYGFSKFILVVPSIPIRMGVVKSIWQLREHFMSLYDGLDITHCYFEYDSKKTLSKLESFISLGNEFQIAIMNYQAFDKSTNIIKNSKEDGKNYWNELKNTNPIVFIDEPQKIIGTDKRKSKALKSIEDLQPLATFMYSATHTNYFNLIYKLDSFDAFKKHLVKKIRVSTIYGNIDKSYPYFRYIKFNNDLSATVEILQENGGIVKLNKINIDRPCDLYEKTHLDQYKEFRILNAPHKFKGIKTNFYSNLIEDTYAFQEGENNYNVYEEDMVKIQMKLTIRKHLDKQIEMLKENVKVLSLFFIDEVAKYRDYSKENTLGIYAQKFEEAYNEVINSDNRYLTLIKEMPSLSNAKKIHEGYFAIDKNKKVLMDENTYIKDTEKTREDIQRGIKKILDGKEKLIQLDEPISFIFAHSALSEGWDNPNVFQLCFLRQSKSEIRKKQEIGRGLRLARGSGEDNDIKRDENINELTVIANEEYEEFAESLQKEFNEEMNYNKDAITIDDAKNIQLKIEKKIEENLSAGFFRILHDELRRGGFIKSDNTMDKNKINSIKTYVFKNKELNRNKDRIINALIEVMTDKESNVIKNYLINDDDTVQNRWNKYVNEENFKKMMKDIEEKLNRRTVYQVKYDENELINDILMEADIKIKSKDLEVVEKTGIVDSSNREKGFTIKEAKGAEVRYKLEEKTINIRSFVEIINYIVNKTNFTRENVIKLMMQSRDPSLYQKQDNIDKLIKIINYQKQIQFYKNMDNIEYEAINERNNITCANMFLTNEIVSSKIGKNVYMSNEENHRAVCKYFVTDSDGEMEFAGYLDSNPNVLMYSKIKKGSFIIENPIENYSPDWIIVYKNNNNNITYFVAETKWKKMWEDLTDKEKIKIVCSRKHFDAINDNISYDWINGIEDFREKSNIK